MPHLTRLRQARDNAFLSQDELAERCGLTPSTISRLENGHQAAQARTVRLLAKALNVKPRDLVDKDDQEGGERKPASD